MVAFVVVDQSGPWNEFIGAFYDINRARGLAWEVGKYALIFEFPEWGGIEFEKVADDLIVVKSLRGLTFHHEKRDGLEDLIPVRWVREENYGGKQ